MLFLDKAPYAIRRGVREEHHFESFWRCGKQWQGGLRYKDGVKRL